MQAKRKLFQLFLSAAFLSAAFLLPILVSALPWRAAYAGSNTQKYGLQDWSDKDQSGWDAFFAREMANYRVYGAVMVVVADGQVVMEKGYGYADAAGQTPMDSRSTILRAGSIAKTVTALAVLQLAEEGKLDLDTDVNDYLTAFELPRTFAEPVTARHLINMTAGFDTRWVGIRAASQDGLRPLGEYLAAHMPPRVLPPGEVRRYNDHELALAGYLVEVISGMPYEEYVRQKIFEPLEMADSTIWLPDNQLGRAARGYPVGAGPEQVYPFSYYYLQDAPGSGFNTTASDMGHLMLAHLQDGSYRRSDGSLAQVLQPVSMRAMHATAFSYHPILPGQANSFDEEFYNGHRYLRKFGGAPGMNNAWLLLPDQGVSLYLFYNSEGFGMRNQWYEQALSKYLASPGEMPAHHQPASQPAAATTRYSGLYRKLSDETSDTTLVKIKALADPDLTVSVEDGANGGLRVWDRAYSPVEPGLFKGSGSNDFIYFSGESGRPAAYLYQERTAFQRVSWLETPRVQYSLAGFGLLVFVVAVLIVAVRLFLRKSQGYRLAGLIAGANLVFVVWLGVLLLPVATGGDVWQFSFEPSIGLRLALGLPLVTLLLAVGLFFQTMLSWRKGTLTGTQGTFNTLVLLGAAAWLVFLNTWNLLGWRF